LAKWEHQIDKDNVFNLTGYFNEFANNFALKPVDYGYQQFALELSHTFKPAQEHTLTWGIDSRVDLVDASNADPFLLLRDRFNTATIGLYIQDEWQLAPQWTLNLGSRIDYEFYGGFHPSARAALSYQLNENSIVYGAVSHAYQMSTVAQRYLNTPMLNGLGYITSDADVDVESLMAYELGYRGVLFDRLETNLNLFWHQYNDLITNTPRLGPPGLFRYHFDNGLNTSIYGLELDLKYPITERLTLLGNYSLQLLNDKGSNSITDMDVTSPPKHKFMLAARYSPTDNLHLSSHLYYVDAVNAPNTTFPLIPRRTDPYFRLDLRAEHQFCNDRASIALGVRNLFDSGHFEGGTQYMNDGQIPRMIYAEFCLNIK
jgi:iron complex outermembrane receptor protein